MQQREAAYGGVGGGNRKRRPRPSAYSRRASIVGGLCTIPPADRPLSLRARLIMRRPWGGRLAGVCMVHAVPTTPKLTAQPRKVSLT